MSNEAIQPETKENNQVFAIRILYSMKKCCWRINTEKSIASKSPYFFFKYQNSNSYQNKSEM